MATYTPDDLMLVRVGSVNFAFPAREHHGVVPRDDTGLSKGSLEHGGQRVTLVNLRARLGLPVEGYAGQVVLGTAGGQRVGLVVDEVLGRLKRSQASPLPLPGELPPNRFSEAFLAHGQITLRTTLATLVDIGNAASLHQLATALPAEKPSGSTCSHVPLDQTLARAAAQLARPQRPDLTQPDGPEKPKTAPPLNAEPAQPLAEGQVVEGDSMTTHKPRERARTLFAGAYGTEQESPESAMFPWPANMRDLRRALGFTALGLAGVVALVWGLQGWRDHQPERTRTAAAQPTELSAPQPQRKASTEPSRTKAPTSAALRNGKGGRERPLKATGEIIHTVVKGDTLWAIANRYTNNPWAYHELANHSGISDPNIIRPGDQVRIKMRKKASESSKR